jgi:hypothetical protein
MLPALPRDPEYNTLEHLLTAGTDLRLGSSSTRKDGADFRSAAQNAIRVVNRAGEAIL